jgi:large subunit ribosomal protein L5
MATLQEKYRNEIAPKLKEELGLDNVMEVPRITKITLNMGVGEAVGDKKVMESALADMTKIAGQKPVVTLARSRLPDSRSATAGRSAARSRCAVSACTSSSSA